MPVLTAGELANLRATQDDTRPDTCQILTPSETTDGYGLRSVTSWVAGAALACKFIVGQTDEVQDEGRVITARAKARLPIGTAVTSANRIRMTKRNGTAITSVDYEILGQPEQHETALLVYLEKVTE